MYPCKLFQNRIIFLENLEDNVEITEWSQLKKTGKLFVVKRKRKQYPCCIQYSDQHQLLCAIEMLKTKKKIEANTENTYHCEKINGNQRKWYSNIARLVKNDLFNYSVWIKIK